MSAIGRVFLILNLILAAVFLGFAANQLAQHANVSKALVDERAAHDATKKAKADEVSALNTQVNTLRSDYATMRDDRDQQKLMSDRNATDLANEKNANAQLRGDLSGVKEQLGGFNSTIKDLSTAKDRLVTEKEAAFAARDAAEADKAKADAARRDAEAALQTAKGEIDSLEKNVASAKRQASDLDTELKALYVATNHPKVGTPVPLIQGAVLSIDPRVSPGLLAINRGKNHGVLRGYVFDIYSGTTYKGQAKVETVRDDVCSALITLVPPGAPPVKQGDSVTTQLGG